MALDENWHMLKTDKKRHNASGMIVARDMSGYKLSQN
jgi:hypothetical protein